MSCFPGETVETRLSVENYTGLVGMSWIRRRHGGLGEHPSRVTSGALCGEDRMGWDEAF